MGIRLAILKAYLYFTNKPALGALHEIEQLKKEIKKRTKNKKKKSHLESRLFELVAMFELLLKDKDNGYM